jgi:hypothetical protein
MSVLENKTRDATRSTVSEFREVVLSREDEGGMIFISSADLPEVFIAVQNEDSVRMAIDTCLNNAFAPSGARTSVYTNGSISGPQINAVVKLSK